MARKKRWHPSQESDELVFAVCDRFLSHLARQYDPREDSPTKGLINEFFIGEQNPMLVKIPLLVVHGYKAVGDRMSAIVNFPTELYNYQDPDEFRIPYNSPDIPYDWDLRMG